LIAQSRAARRWRADWRLLSRGSHAPDYPSHGLKIVNPFAAGGSTDTLSRGLAQKLSDYLGQSVIVETKTGANGIVGATTVARAAPDGYTILLTTGSHTANPHVTAKLPYDALGDFAPISQIAGSYGLVLLSNLAVKSLPELVALAKTKPDGLSYATSGIGNLTHVAGRLLEARAGIKLVAVPYNGPNLLIDTITGVVDMTFISTITAVPFVNSGKIKALAITGTQRCPAFPDTPTLRELGYSDYDLTGFFGILTTGGTPADRVERLYRETARALATPDMTKLIDDAGLFTVGSTPAEFAAFLKNDFAYQGRLMDELGMKAK
jgi:tripartite-type tricarboxylate transporter receptor subunit TctC